MDHVAAWNAKLKEEKTCSFSSLRKRVCTVAPFTTQKLWAVFFFFFAIIFFKVALKEYFHNYCGNIWVFLKWCGLDSFPKNRWLTHFVTTSWPTREEEGKKMNSGYRTCFQLKCEVEYFSQSLLYVNEVKFKDVDCRVDYGRSMCLLMMCADLYYSHTFGVVPYIIC